MRDLLSKLDAIVSETALKDKEDLEAKRKALQDLQLDPVAGKDPEISQAIIQRKADLEREAKSKGFTESEDLYQVGDDFGISFSEDFEIATEIVDILEDGIVVELDDYALNFLTNEGFQFADIQVDEEKQKGVDGKACWKGYRRMGTKKKGGKTVDNCVKVGEGKFPFAGAKVGQKEGPAGQLKGTDPKGYPKGKLVGGGESINNEGFGSMEERVQELLKKFDSNMNEIGGYGDPDYKEIIQHLKNGDAESAAEVVWYAYTDQDGGEFPEKEDYVDDLQAEFEELVDGGDQDSEPDGSYDSSDDADALASAGHGSDEDYGSFGYDEDIEMEAKYRGKEVPLGKKLPGDVKKSKVYVRKPNGNIVKVNFGDKKMRIKKSNPKRRKSFRARHNCKNPGPRWKARYWSCSSW